MKKIIKISFNEFLKKGELCGIEFESSRNSVFQTFGKPVTWSERRTTKFEDAIWWIYGKLQIRFSNNIVDVFGFYFLMDYEETENFLIQDLPVKYMTMNAFCNGQQKTDTKLSCF